MKLKLTIFPLAFLVSTLSGFPVRSWASKTDDLMQECVKSPKHLIKKGDIYYACDSVSGVGNVPLAMKTADSRARTRLAFALNPGKNSTTLSMTIPIDHWQDTKSASSPMWALVKYKPSPAEKKKLDNFISGKATNGKNSGINSQQLAKNVAKATGGVGQAFPSKDAGSPNPPSSQGMGNLSQSKGTASPSSPSSGATNTSPNGNQQNSDQLPLLQKTKTPPETPPAPTTDKPKKSKPGFFAKIWNGIKKVGHYIATSRIATGLLLGAAAALMVTGFGAAPGVIIAAAVLGGGIGLAAGPLTKSSSSKTLPPPPPIASSPTNSNNPNPAPATPPSPNSPAASTPPGSNNKIDPTKTLGDAAAIAKALAQSKSTGSGLPSVAVPPHNNVTQNSPTPSSSANNKHEPAHKKNQKTSSQPSTTPASPSKSTAGTKTTKHISIAKSAGYFGALGGALGVGLAATGAITLPIWASAAIGAATVATVAAAGAAAWNYFENKSTPPAQKPTPAKTSNLPKAANTPKTPTPPKSPIPGPQEM